ERCGLVELVLEVGGLQRGAALVLPERALGGRRQHRVRLGRQRRDLARARALKEALAAKARDRLGHLLRVERDLVEKLLPVGDQAVERLPVYLLELSVLVDGAQLLAALRLSEPAHVRSEERRVGKECRS